jgi:tripartite-type tricarboxylate transporter receptor subunit TctC
MFGFALSTAHSRESGNPESSFVAPGSPLSRGRAGWWFSVALLTLSVASGAQAQSFPNQQVRVVVPISAGSVTDILARTVGEKLAETWRQQVIVENRPGVPGVASAAKSPADGHTLMLFSNGLTILNALNRNLSFDPVNDFSGVTKVGSVPFILIANPSLPAKSVKELIALAKAKPGTVNIAVPGRGTAASIASELFRREAGVDIVAVPYKGAPEAHTSVLRGDAHVFFSNLSAASELIHSGKVRPLAVSTRERLPAFPDIPTLAEAGLPNFDYDAWFGVLVPAATPRTIVEALDRDISAVVKSADMKLRLERQGMDLRLSTPAAFDAEIRKDAARFGPLFKE